MKYATIAVTTACTLFSPVCKAQPGNLNGWATEPLGATAGAGEMPPSIKEKLESRHRKFPAEGAPLVLVEEGKAQCLLILPATPSEAEHKAAELLRTTLREMSGVELPLTDETKVRPGPEATTLVDTDGQTWKHAIWIGNTREAAQRNLDAKELSPEGYRLESVEGWLFLTGNDQTSSKREARAVLFAAASLLENHLGVRWLWPGTLGTVIPKRASVSLPPLREQDEPALRQRLIRNGSGITDRNRVGLKLLGGSDRETSNFLAIQKGQARWLALQKSGTSLRLNYRHAFEGWFEKYGAKHPDWFALQANGSREQKSERPRLCKANPEVALQKAREIVAEYQANPGLDSASISPNDGSGVDSFCLCPECRKLDPINGRGIRIMIRQDGKRTSIPYVSLSDRIATFYNRIAEEVAKTLPQARLGAYAYSAYRDAPLGVTLHPSIIIGFVGLDYFDEKRREEDLQRWDGWSRHATTLLLRPNLLLSGQSLPAVYVNRMGDDIRHCYQTGMALADFDSLAGNWATQGLNYYVLAKLLWDPTTDVNALVKDYCQSGFGPAAEMIATYFAEVEKATLGVARREGPSIENELREEENDTRPANPMQDEKAAFEKAYFHVFTPELVAQLRTLLEKANTAAGEDADIHARIRFLGLGLDYSDLYRATLEASNKKQANKDLLDWYRKTYHEDPQAIGIVGRLFRTGASFRNLP